jgi:hypothetical protein
MEPSKGREGIEAGDSDHVGDWPTGRNKIETPKHVHAFGMIALSSAMLEEILVLLLITYLRPIARDVAMRLTAGLNNRDRADWLRALVRANESDEELLDLIAYAIKCCDICLDNRNMLVHALYTGTDKVTANMQLAKRARNDPLREIRFEVSTQRLRQIADDIGNTVNFMVDLWFCKTHKPMDPHFERLPLPEKPPQPDRLTIPQPSANP